MIKLNKFFKLLSQKTACILSKHCKRWGDLDFNVIYLRTHLWAQFGLVARKPIFEVPVEVSPKLVWSATKTSYKVENFNAAITPSEKLIPTVIRLCRQVCVFVVRIYTNPWVKVQNFKILNFRKSEFKTCCMPPNYQKFQV